MKKTDWQTALVNSITDPKELLAILELDETLLEQATAAAKLFPLQVPRGFVARMQKKNIHDPLLAQILPLGLELHSPADFVADPLKELEANPVPGLLHKYYGRVLLTFTGTCGVNCRFCFRRTFPYGRNNPGTAGWKDALDYIARDTSISEVIISGGDPLVASDNLFRNLIEKIAAIPHVTRFRIHSRMPIVLPERITSEFIAALTTTRLKSVMVIHSNHPQEINEDVHHAIEKLLNAKILVLNHSVLLKGVNDNAETLIALSKALFEMNVLPYYLNVLDKVQGAAHFDLPRETARQLYTEMIKRLPGYLVPKLAWEQPGAPAKVLIDLCTG